MDRPYRQRALSFNHSIPHKPKQRRPKQPSTIGHASSIDESNSEEEEEKTKQKLYDDGTSSTYPPRAKQRGDWITSRDQYGFLKSTQWITEEEHDEFENYYAPIMKRRLQKWKQLLSDHHSQWPPKSNKRK
ncbi:hypothetical protein G6F56_013313 [Rhizopus delemar]|nr:hypothetical protein G6F56_013313 [Rhizopus delemar]